MRALAVDIGTGTQDILLWDSETTVENCLKLVIPSPTVVVAQRVRAATAAGLPVLLEGTIMGGGPCAWAANDHVKAGLPVYATPSAAQTFDDDLDAVRASGVVVVSEDEAAALAARSHVQRIVMRDLVFDTIIAALASFGVEPRLDAVAAAAFDHGAAPPGYSDRVFRFDYLARTIPRTADGDLSAFAHLRGQIPPAMTRLRAVADSYPGDLPMLLMDTGPAAVLGALEDPRVRLAPERVVANLGNFHTLAFHFSTGKVAGLFEHHTGELSVAELEAYLRQLADGTIDNQVVYQDMGHGALVTAPDTPPPAMLAVTGPRRSLLAASPLDPYFAVPHGDMMIAGCFGLIRALPWLLPEAREAVERSLGPR